MNNVQEKRDSIKQHFKMIGYALFWLIITFQVAQGIVAGLVTFFAPNLLESSWYLGIVLGIGFYGTAFPLFLWVIKKVTNGPKGPAKKLSVKQLVSLLFISTGLVYLFAGLSILLEPLIPLTSPFQIGQLTTSFEMLIKSLPILLFLDIFSPIIEEMIFRGVLLDKLRGYGDRRAILFSAVVFALFHGN